MTTTISRFAPEYRQATIVESAIDDSELEFDLDDADVFVDDVPEVNILAGATADDAMVLERVMLARERERTMYRQSTQTRDMLADLLLERQERRMRARSTAAAFVLGPVLIVAGLLIAVVSDVDPDLAAIAIVAILAGVGSVGAAAVMVVSSVRSASSRHK